MAYHEIREKKKICLPKFHIICLISSYNLSYLEHFFKHLIVVILQPKLGYKVNSKNVANESKNVENPRTRIIRARNRHLNRHGDNRIKGKEKYFICRNKKQGLEEDSIPARSWKMERSRHKTAARRLGIIEDLPGGKFRLVRKS